MLHSKLVLRNRIQEGKAHTMRIFKEKFRTSVPFTKEQEKILVSLLGDYWASVSRNKPKEKQLEIIGRIDSEYSRNRMLGYEDEDYTMLVKEAIEHFKKNGGMNGK